MNILAHLHLATLAESSILGNSAADFIRGDPYQQFAATIADGVKMHRRIDSLIDTLAEVKQAKACFIAQHQRVASIALDIIWDHFLSRYWSDYSPALALSQFNQNNRCLIEPDLAMMPLGYQEFMFYLWQDNWLVNYANCDFIEKVLTGMATRRPKLYLLAACYHDFIAHYSTFQLLFNQFYPRLVQRAQLKQL